MSDESLLTPSDTGDTGDNPQPAPAENSWLWGEEVPGTGAAPEWFNSAKYKSVAEQAKAYPELEKRFGSFTGAPESYEVPEASVFAENIDLPEGVDFNLDKDDPLLQSFSAAAKDMGINQDGFNKLVGLYIQQQVNDYAATMTTAADQKKMLGDNADERLNNIARWGAANMDEDMFGKLTESLTTAAAVEAVEYLIGKTRNSSLPNPADVTPRPAVTKADYDEAMAAKGENGELLFFTDPVYRAKVEKMGKQVFGTQPTRQIMG